MVLVKLFLISIIGGTLLLSLFMLPIYFIRKKRNPNDKRNTIARLIVSAFLAVSVMTLLGGSGLIAMYIDDMKINDINRGNPTTIERN